MIDLDWLRQIVDMVVDSEIDSLEVSRFGTRVRISKSPPVHLAPVSSAAAGSAALPEAPAAESPSPAPAPTVQPAEEDRTVAVASPMVGTFYRAAAPDAPPYVEVGDRVQKGQTICILEAMKLMNELEAEVSGTVREICVGNGDPVEYGQALFRIEPA